MLRIQPDFEIRREPHRHRFSKLGVDSADIYEAVKAALMRVPRFMSMPDSTIKVAVVIPDTLMREMHHMRAPYDDPTERDLTRYMLDTLTDLGLYSFVQDDDDEVAAAEHDAKVLDVLRSHPDAYMIGMERHEVGGVVYWQPKA